MTVDKIILPISAIIPCYQSAETIKRAVDSIWMQSNIPAQIILIDDASRDGSLEVLHGLQQDYPSLNILVEELKLNGGPGLARNRGWELATQPWLAFLDADDAWHPRKIQLQWEFICANPKAALVGTLTKEISPSVEVSDTALSSLLHAVKITFIDMIISCRFYTRTVMLRRDIPYRFSDRRYTEDYLLWLEIILSDLDAYVIQEDLAFSFRPEFSGGGYSAHLWKHEKRELNAWHYLYRKKKISLSVLLIAISWSYAKYLRRVMKRFF